MIDVGIFRHKIDHKTQELASAMRHSGPLIPTHVDMSEFVKGASSKRFIVIGEIHSDPLALNLVEPFVHMGNVIFAEALIRGDFSVEGDSLKRSGVYAWNSAKYDRLLESCILSGAAIHGIDLAKEERGVVVRSVDDEEKRVSKWAEYIMKNMAHEGQNVVIVGALHVDPPNLENVDLSRMSIGLYSDYTIRANIISHLVAGGISEDDIISIVMVRGMPGGVYKSKVVEGVKTANFIYKI